MILRSGLLLFFWWLPDIAIAIESQVFSVDDIVAAWSGREKTTQTARFEWTWDRAGHYRWGGNRPEWSEEGQNGDQSQPDNVFIFDRQAYRYETSRQIYDNRILLRPDLTNQYDIAILKEFRDREIGVQTSCAFSRLLIGSRRIDRYEGGPFRQARWVESLINPNAQERSAWFHAKIDQATDFDSLDYAALLVHFRPLSAPEIGVQLERLTVGRTTNFHGRPCIELVETLRKSAPVVRRTFWVDPRRDAIVYRCRTDMASKRLAQIDIEYESDAEAGWVPHSWTVQAFSERYDHWPRFQRAVVHDWSQKERGSPDLFSPEYSVGDTVVDLDKNANFIIRDSGRREPLSASVVAELITDSQTLNNYAPSVHSLRMILTVFGVVVGVATLALMRMQRRSSTDSVQNPTTSR